MSGETMTTAAVVTYGYDQIDHFAIRPKCPRPNLEALSGLSELHLLGHAWQPASGPAY
jgi:hypothetical protein